MQQTNGHTTGHCRVPTFADSKGRPTDHTMARRAASTNWRLALRNTSYSFRLLDGGRACPPPKLMSP
eukprot:987851-Pleurochrysis_carterae.AAC.1